MKDLLPRVFFASLVIFILTAVSILWILPFPVLVAHARPLALAGVAILLISAFLSREIARRIADPLLRLGEQMRPDLFNSPAPHRLNREATTGIREIQDLEHQLLSIMQQAQERISDLTLDGALLRSLLNGLKAGVICIDSGGRILFRNDRVDAALLDLAAPSDRYVETIRHPVMLDYVSRMMKGTLGEDGADRSALAEGVWLDTGELEFHAGEHCFHLRHRLVRRDGEQVFYLIIIEDVTQEYRTRRIREDFFQNASHELKTPITSIRGYAETLLPRMNEPVQRRFLEGIVRNAERMDRLVHDMVVVSSLESRAYPFSPELIDLSEFLEQMQLLVEGLLKQKGQELLIEMAGGPLHVRGDRLLLEHLFVNLIGNASRYSPEGGEIRISLRRLDAARLELRVTDRGPGIPEEYREKIFERFFRINQDRSRKEGGTGLGLSIVRHVVRLHSGSIRVESAQGGGACFVVVLPAG